MIQLWKMGSFNKLNINLFYNPVIPLLGTYLRKINVHKMTHTRISIAPLFIIGKKLETTQMSTNHRTDKL